MRTTFEKTRCGVLRINSSPKPSEQGSYLTQEDHMNIENYVKDLTFKAVIPHLERVVALLSEHV
jgi:hypothetical protein